MATLWQRLRDFFHLDEVSKYDIAARGMRFEGYTDLDIIDQLGDRPSENKGERDAED